MEKTVVLLGRVGNGKSAVGNSIIGNNVFLSTVRALGKSAVGRVGNGKSAVGRVGNGKSVVGNSIIGNNVFLSTVRASGVTTTCKLEKTMLDDGQVVNVIDTPGKFDSSRGTEILADELFKCIDRAKDGIDGFLFVCSIRSRFSTEEEGVLRCLKKIFGDKIMDYMIVVFTGGDELDTTFREYLDNCPPTLKAVLQQCQYRVVLFDNRTREEAQRKSQVQQLMSHIAKIRYDNNGQSYTSDVFAMMKATKAGHWEGEQSENSERELREMEERANAMMLCPLMDPRRERGLAPTYTLCNLQ